jgi:hypothetical protein
MKKKPLRVRLCATQPGVVEITVGDRAQLDQLVAAPHGTIARRHGELLRPGKTQVSLDAGNYMFRTLSDAHLRVVAGGVTVTRSVDPNNKTAIPSSPPHRPTDTPPSDDPQATGDEPTGEIPNLTIE